MGLRAREGVLDVLGGVAEVFADDGGVIDLIHGLAEAQGDGEGGAGLAGAGVAVEVQDAAAALRGDLREAENSVEGIALFDGAQAGKNVGLDLLGQDQMVETVAGLGGDEEPDFGIFWISLTTPAGVTLVGTGGGVRGEFLQGALETFRFDLALATAQEATEFAFDWVTGIWIGHRSFG